MGDAKFTTRKTKPAMLRKTLYALLVMLLLALPAALGSVMLHQWAGGATFLDFSPLSPDEILYWQQFASATEYPRITGHYSNFEIVPPIEIFGRYQLWGPFVPHYYALFGRLLGWQYYTPILVNVISITTALGLFVAVVRPRLWGLALLILAVVGFTPLWLYLPTGLTETLHQASAVGVAAGFAVLLRTETPRPRFLWGFAAYLLLITLTLRVTWAVLLPPLAIIALWRRGWRATVGGVLASGVGAVLMFGLRSNLWATFPEQFNERVRVQFQESASAGFAFWWEHILYNINGMNWSPYTNQAFYIGMGWLLILLAAQAVVFALVWRLRAASAPSASTQHIFYRETAFNAYNLIAITAVIVVFYDIFDWRGYRTIAPHLFAVLLILAVMRWRGWLIAGALVFALYGLPDARTVYQDYYWTGHGHYTGLAATLTEPYAEIATHLTLDRAPANGWCNAITVSQFEVGSILAIPAGFGINMALWGHDQFFPPESYWFKSRYLWMSAELHDRYAPNGASEQIAVVNGVPLYRNLASACDARP